jgi:hypothetical protein
MAGTRGFGVANEAMRLIHYSRRKANEALIWGCLAGVRVRGSHINH